MVIGWPNHYLRNLYSLVVPTCIPVEHEKTEYSEWRVAKACGVSLAVMDRSGLVPGGSPTLMNANR